MLSVLLVDDHGVVLHGLEALLSTTGDIRIAGTCINGEEAVEFVTRERPDVLVLDLNLPDLSGLEVLSVLSIRGVLPPTVLVTASVEEWQVTEALSRGAWGVVMKDQAPEVIVESIYAANAGVPWDPKLARFARRGGGACPEDLLTPREREIAVRVVRGQSNKAIAKALGIAEGTVKAHVYRCFKKMGVASRVELTLSLRDEAGRRRSSGGRLRP